MKKLRLMSLIVLIPIVLGIGLLFGGSYADNETAYHVGAMMLTAGIPATMFVLIVISLVLIITGKLDLSDNKKAAAPKSSEERDEQSDRVREYSDLTEINTSRGYNSKIKEAEYIARHTSNAYKNSSTKEKVFGWLFFGFLMTDFALIMVFGFLGIFVGAIVCFCLFGGTILTALLVTVIRQKISMRGGIGRRKNREVSDGVVKACLLSSTTSSGSRTTRINKVVYMVTIAADQNEYTAYTEDYYETGDKIKFWKIGKQLATILDEDELDELEDDYEPLD